MSKKPPVLKLNKRDVEILYHIVKTYPAQPIMHDDIIRLYDILTKYLSEL